MVAGYQTEQSSKSKTISINRKNYAFGLFWQTVDNPKNINSSAKSTARMPGINADLWLSRTGAIPQFALGRTEDGLKPGAMSAALIMAEAIEGSWAGAFQIGEEGWWVIVSIDDTVIPGGDEWLDTEEEARAHLTHIITEYNDVVWKNIFAPEEWEIDSNSEYFSPEEFIGDSKSQKLKSIYPLRTNIKLIAATGLLVLIGAGGLIATKNYLEQSQQSLASQVRKSTIQAVLNVENPVRIQDTFPWEEEIRAGTFFKTCSDNHNIIPAMGPGYNLNKVACSIRKNRIIIEAQYLPRSKQYKPAPSWFNVWANEELENKFSASANNNSAHIYKSTTEFPGRGDGDKLPHHNKVRPAFENMAAAIKDSITIGKIKNAPQPEGVKDVSNWQPPWASMQVEITTADPALWKDWLDAFPAYVPEKAEFDTKQLKWKMIGRSYVKP